MNRLSLTHTEDLGFGAYTFIHFQSQTGEATTPYNISRTCNVPDRFAHTEAVFGDFAYVIMETFDNRSCASFGEADVFLASGSCEISSSFGDQSAITSLFANGSAVVALYPNNACGGEPSLYFELDKTALSTGSCQDELYRFYSSSDVGSSLTSTTASSSSPSQSESSRNNGGSASANDASDGSSIGIGAIIGLVAAALVVVVLVALCIVRRVRKKLEAELEEENDNFTDFRSPQDGRKNVSSTAQGSLESTLAGSHNEAHKPLSLDGLWDDEVIATARIPREKCSACLGWDSSCSASNRGKLTPSQRVSGNNSVLPPPRNSLLRTR
ncbi:hypothetical protein PHYPSEUDO_008697 [Phytophthora pseudosyringae]|uniref:TKL protein kinase n=1 Tax=Phytophthora pseudosyringae TaxID=221518 RepID=A0A8T1VDH8_9STRA|nr:hypothetical protein PHYPSEUDO_008697 [Phytophthora pseudosyringae]